MTNREYIVNLLQDEDCFDDGCAKGESMIYYNIACPYSACDERCHCRNKEITRDRCVECKSEWLDMEVDE